MISALSWMYLDPASGREQTLGKRDESMAHGGGENLERNDSMNQG
jgi:hypothetical protein